MSRTPVVIPVFVAHQGCPHRCIFCDQHRISGRDDREPSAAAVVEEVRQALGWSRRRAGAYVQVAFYGGSLRASARNNYPILLVFRPVFGVAARVT